MNLFKFKMISLTVLFCTAGQMRADVKSGTISQPETWSGEITVAGNVNIRTDVTVEAGTHVRFEGESEVVIRVNSGNLLVKGTADKPVRFSGSPQHRGYLTAGGGYLGLSFAHLTRVGVSTTKDSTDSSPMLMEDCVVSDAQVGSYHRSVTIRRSFMEAGDCQYALVSLAPGSELSDSVLIGGTWISRSLGGVISNNVFVSQIVPPGGNVNDYTHEHICGLHPEAVVERNIFVGDSYAAIMLIGAANGNNALIRNNTVDLRNKRHSGIMFHMTKPKSDNLTVRNNLFMCCIGIEDEQKIPGAIAYSDYNLFADVAMRHRGVTVGEGKEGGDYEQHSISVEATDAVCTNPGFGYPFPHTAEAFISGQVTVAQVLQQYREAYTPIAVSPLIDAGHPEDGKNVPDGRCDIGAVEFKK